ncbi:MAG: hypothetical protein ACI3Z0_06760 [Candidatus Cryptobacteroides sp.]
MNAELIIQILTLLLGGGGVIAEDVKVSETYSSAARNVLLNNLPVRFTSEDMQALSVKLGKSIRTIQRQVRRAIQNGQVKELSKGRYEKF